jgi:Zn-dependent alcohol dehydrogenase
MRAAVMTEPDRTLELRDRSPRRLRPTEVHVRIDASGVCHSDETIRRQGMGGLAPVILGHEGAGTVLEVGEELRDLAPDDRVIGAGRLDLAGAVTRRIRLDQVNEACDAMAGGEVIRPVIMPGGGSD